jgi:hypothetical protein
MKVTAVVIASKFASSAEPVIIRVEGVEPVWTDALRAARKLKIKGASQSMEGTAKRTGGHGWQQWDIRTHYGQHVVARIQLAWEVT